MDVSSSLRLQMIAMIAKMMNPSSVEVHDENSDTTVVRMINCLCVVDIREVAHA